MTTSGRWPFGDDTRASWWAVAALVLLALSASAIGAANGFTYDDRYIIEFNPPVHSLRGWWHLFAQAYWPKEGGSDGYRPLTMLLFAMEWVVGRGSPVIFHVVNIVLYAANAVAAFALASLLVPLWAAWLMAALFAVHPVHVEAVGNAVGQSELLAGLTMISAVTLYVRGRRAGSLTPATMVGIVVLYAVACLTKEHGIVLPALFVAAELLLIAEHRPIRARLRELRPFALALVMVAVAFLAARSLVLTENGVVGFRPAAVFLGLKVSFTDRVLTMLGVAPAWLRLLLWPARLSMDYSPPYVDIAQGPAINQIPGLLLLGGTLGLGLALWRRRPVMSFGIAWACLTLLPSSNFIVPAGIILAERTLFLPSLGVLLALVDALVWVAPGVQVRWARPALAAGVIVVLAAGALWSARRTTVWHDNERLFRQTVADFPDSYRAHHMLGVWAFHYRRFSEGERETLRALKLFPYDPNISRGLADQYHAVGQCGLANRYYRLSLSIDPTIDNSEYIKCLVKTGEYDEANAQLKVAIKNLGPTPFVHSLIVWTKARMAADSAKRGSASLAAAPGKVPESMQKAAREKTDVTEKPGHKSY